MKKYDPIIVHLIKLDLYNYKMINYYKTCPKYTDFDIRAAVFKHMQIENHLFVIVIYCNYVDMLRKVMEIELCPVEIYISDLTRLAVEIWHYLEFARTELIRPCVPDFCEPTCAG